MALSTTHGTSPPSAPLTVVGFPSEALAGALQELDCVRKSSNNNDTDPVTSVLALK